MASFLFKPKRLLFCLKAETVGFQVTSNEPLSSQAVIRLSAADQLISDKNISK